MEKNLNKLTPLDLDEEPKEGEEEVAKLLELIEVSVAAKFGNGN